MFVVYFCIMSFLVFSEANLPERLRILEIPSDPDKRSWRWSQSSLLIFENRNLPYYYSCIVSVVSFGLWKLNNESKKNDTQGLLWIISSFFVLEWMQFPNSHTAETPRNYAQYSPEIFQRCLSRQGCSILSLVDTVLVDVWIVTEHCVCADPAWSSHSSVCAQRCSSEKKQTVLRKPWIDRSRVQLLRGALSEGSSVDAQGDTFPWNEFLWDESLCESSLDDPRPRLYLCRGSPDPGLSASLPGSWGVL